MIVLHGVTPEQRCTALATAKRIILDKDVDSIRMEASLGEPGNFGDGPFRRYTDGPRRICTTITVWSWTSPERRSRAHAKKKRKS